MIFYNNSSKNNFLIIAILLLGVNSYSQISPTLYKDTLHLTRISIYKSDNVFINSYDYIEIGGKYYNANVNFPFSYFACLGRDVIDLEKLEPIINSVNTKRENRFFKTFNEKLSKEIESEVIADSLPMAYIKNIYENNIEGKNFKFYKKSICLYATYYLVKCENSNYHFWSTNVDLFQNPFYIFTIDYIKWK